MSTRTAVVAVVLSLLLAIAGWHLYQRSELGSSASARLGGLEQALARPGLLGLAHLDVNSSVALLEELYGPAVPNPESLLGRLTRSGFDFQENMRELVVAAYASSEDRPEFVAVGIGRFSPEAFASFLRSSQQAQLQRRMLSGREVIEVFWKDRATCEPSGPWVVEVTSSRFIIGDPKAVGEVLAGLQKPGKPERDLSRWRAFKAERLAGLALFPGAELASVPFLGGLPELARGDVDRFEAAYLGARFDASALVLTLQLEAENPSTAVDLRKVWAERVSAAGRGWKRTLPTLGHLYDGLQVEHSGSQLVLEASLDQEWVRSTERIPGEVVRVLFSGLMNASPGEAPVLERLDESPLLFREFYPIGSIPPYDPEEAFAGPTDVQKGPFGIRLSSIVEPKDPNSGLEIEVEAIGTGILNLGMDHERVLLNVTSVKAHDGRELLQEEYCGPDRNGLPVPLRGAHAGRVLLGSKKIRLKREARLTDIRTLSGHLELRLPIRTESFMLQDPKPGSSVSRSGALVELADVKDGSFSYRLSGVANQLLHMRALNAHGHPLASDGQASMPWLWGQGRSGSLDFAGKIKYVEMFFALEENTRRFPFELTELRPGTDGEQVRDDPVEFVSYSREQLAKEFARHSASRKDREGALAVSPTGPFLIRLDDIYSFWELTPSLQVRAPAIPNLEKSLNGLELVLQRVSLVDGSSHRAPSQGWRSFLPMRRSRAEGQLSAQLALPTGLELDAEQITGLSGALVLRLPGEMETLRLDEIELGGTASGAGISVRVTALGRDSFTLSVPEGGERVVAVRAFNPAGKELWIPSSEVSWNSNGWSGVFSPKGVPSRIEVWVANRVERIDYGYSLRVEDDA